MYENQVRLGELITILSGFPFDSHRFTDAPGQPLIRIRDLLSNELKTFYSGPFDERYLVDNGEILVGMDGDFNVIRWTKGPALLNQRVCLIKPKTAKLDKSFLFWLLGPEIDSIHRVTPQTTVKHLSVNNLKDVMFRLPEPEHQKKIAQILDTLDTQIQKTEALIAKLEKIKEGLLHDLLTRGVDQNGQLRSTPEQAPEIYKESALGLIPKEWEVPTLQELSLSPICYGIVQVGSYFSGGVPVLAIRDLTGDFKTGLHQTSPTINKAYPRSQPRPLDILISIKGTIGRIGIVPKHFKGNISRDIAVIRPSNRVFPKYLLHALRSRRGQQILLRAQVGTTRAELSIAPLKLTRFFLPELQEQELIAQQANSADQRIENERAALNKLQKQKTGLMDDLLTGKVRVTALLKDAV